MSITIYPTHLYTIPQAANLLGVGQHTVRSYLADGVLPSVKPTPESWRRISGQALMDFLEGTVQDEEKELETVED